MADNLNNFVAACKKLSDSCLRASKAFRRFNYCVFNQHLNLHLQNDYPVLTVEIEGHNLPEGSEDFDIESIVYWPDSIEIQWLK